MAEHIERAALYNKIAALEELARNRYLDTPSSSPAYPRYHAQLNERTALKHLVADFPADADVAPVRYGEWIADDYAYNRCSVCGWEWDDREYVTPYCPNCGANMDGDE